MLAAATARVATVGEHAGCRRRSGRDTQDVGSRGAGRVLRAVLGAVRLRRHPLKSPCDRGERLDRPPYQPRDDGVSCETGPRVLGPRRRRRHEAHARVVRVRGPVLRRRNMEKWTRKVRQQTTVCQLCVVKGDWTQVRGKDNASVQQREHRASHVNTSITHHASEGERHSDCGTHARHTCSAWDRDPSLAYEWYPLDEAPCPFALRTSSCAASAKRSPKASSPSTGV